MQHKRAYMLFTPKNKLSYTHGNRDYTIKGARRNLNREESVKSMPKITVEKLNILTY